MKKFVNVFGLKVPIRRRKGLLEEGIAGFYDPMKKEIVVDARLKGYDLQHTILHEVVHAVADRTGIMQTKVLLEVVELFCENVPTALLENFKISAVNGVSRRPGPAKKASAKRGL